MNSISFARNILIGSLMIALPMIHAQARLGSEKMDEARPDGLTRILSVLESFVRGDSQATDFEAELVVTAADNWPLNKKVLHEQLMSMIRSTLTTDVIIGNGEGAKNSEHVYMLHVPVNTAELRLDTRGGSGDIDLYVMRGNIPSASRHDCSSTRRGTHQSCTIRNPEPGIYYVMLHGNGRYYGVSVTGAYKSGKQSAALAPSTGASDTPSKPPRI